jgi:hypothetical protein
MSAPQLIAISFGDQFSNGIYELKGTHDGQPFYLKKDNTAFDVYPKDYLLIFNYEYGPYSFFPAWYILEIVQILMKALVSRSEGMYLSINH